MAAPGRRTAVRRKRSPRGASRGHPTRVIAITETCDLWHAPDRTAYITFPAGDHRETWPLDSRQCRLWLRNRAYRENASVPGAQAIEDAIRFLESRAIFEGPLRKPLKRVGEVDGKWYVDICDPSWRVVEIRRDGWTILDSHEIPFRRTDAMQPLPAPEGGSLSCAASSMSRATPIS